MSRSLGWVAFCCWVPSVRYQSTVSSRIWMTWSAVNMETRESWAAALESAACATAQPNRKVASRTSRRTKRRRMPNPTANHRVGFRPPSWRRRTHLNPEHLADQPQGFRTIPCLSTIDLFEHTTVGVDEHGQRQPVGSQHVFHLQFRIDELTDGGIGLPEQRHGLFGVVISRDADHGEMAGGIQPGEPFQ